MTLSIRLGPETEKKLEQLAKETGRTKTWYIRRAIDEYLQDWEDYHIAISRLEKEKGKIDISKARKKLGLATHLSKKGKPMKQRRKYANHWEWPDKLRKELGIVEDWLESMRLAGENIYSEPRNGPSPNQAPDCIILDKNGKNVAVELREFVCQKAVEENQKRERGKEVYRDWSYPEVVNEIREILKKKDQKNYHGGPYSKIILLIHIDEPVISYSDYKEPLASEKFNSLRQVNEAFLVFSYDPGTKERYPYIKLTFKQ